MVKVAQMRSFFGFPAVLFLALTAASFWPGTAFSKTSVTIRNCSNIQYVSIKSYNPWDSGMTLPFQYGTGYVYPVNHGDSATMECDQRWFSNDDSCKIFADKESVLHLIETLKSGTHHITINKTFADGAGDC